MEEVCKEKMVKGWVRKVTTCFYGAMVPGTAIIGGCECAAAISGGESALDSLLHGVGVPLTAGQHDTVFGDLCMAWGHTRSDSAV